MGLAGTVTLCDPEGQLGALSSWRAGKAQFREEGCWCPGSSDWDWVSRCILGWGHSRPGGDWPPPTPGPSGAARLSDVLLSPSSVQKEGLLATSARDQMATQCGPESKSLFQGSATKEQS